MKPIVHLGFADFCWNYAETDNFFSHLLSERFEVRICDQPDFLIYSDFGHAHRLHTCTKIFFTGEASRPNWRECDYAFTTHPSDHPRHMRLPFYVLYGSAESLLSKRPEDAEPILASKTRFCGFICSSHNRRKNRNRLEFFEKLSRYQRVDSGGRFRNNLGGPIPGGSAGKIEFLRSCKFNIAFENQSKPGYTTEKIFEPMVARSLPIYWGNPRIHEEFNPRSFLNYADYGSDEALIEKIIELDRDDAKYLEYVRQPYFPDNRPNEFFSRERLLDQFERIFTQRITPVARRRRLLSFGRWTLAKRYHFRPW